MPAMPKTVGGALDRTASYVLLLGPTLPASLINHPISQALIHLVHSNFQVPADLASLGPNSASHGLCGLRQSAKLSVSESNLTRQSPKNVVNT